MFHAEKEKRMPRGLNAEDAKFYILCELCALTLRSLRETFCTHI